MDNSSLVNCTLRQAFAKEINDLTLACHIHSLVVANEGEQDATGDEGSLDEEDWCWF